MNKNIEHDSSTVHRHEVTITTQLSKGRTRPTEGNNYHLSHILCGATKSNQESHSNLDDWLSYDSEPDYTNERTKTDKNDNEKTADTTANCLCETPPCLPYPLLYSSSTSSYLLSCSLALKLIALLPRDLGLVHYSESQSASLFFGG